MSIYQKNSFNLIRENQRSLVTFGSGRANRPKTSIMTVAEQFFPDSKIVGATNFDNAYAKFLAGQADTLLVSAKYAEKKNLFTKVKIVKSFLAVVPALVLISSKPSYAETLYYHCRDQPVIDSLSGDYKRTIFVNSSAKALQLMMLKQFHMADCITTTAVADFYNLHHSAQARPAIKKRFILFQSK